jgi:hypothetical protein
VPVQRELERSGPGTLPHRCGTPRIPEGTLESLSKGRVVVGIHEDPAGSVVQNLGHSSHRVGDDGDPEAMASSATKESPSKAEGIATASREARTAAMSSC